MIDSHLVWEVLLVDGRACPVACAGDPFALPAQGERNKKEFMPRTFHFHCYWVLAQEQSKKQTSLQKERMEGLVQNEIIRSNRMNLLVLKFKGLVLLWKK